VDDLGSLDLIAGVVDGREAGREVDGAVEVGRLPAEATNHVVVVVAARSL
jgi:hypothetical protein